MDTKQFITTINGTHPLDSIYTRIEKKYGSELPDEVRRILTLSRESLFWDTSRFCRLLSLPEIISASENLHVNFTELHMIPCFDCGENDFIVYLIDKNQWAMFNIIDECMWKQCTDLKTLLP